jgi:hypothetical protein
VYWTWFFRYWVNYCQVFRCFSFLSFIDFDAQISHKLGFIHCVFCCYSFALHCRFLLRINISFWWNNVLHGRPKAISIHEICSKCLASGCGFLRHEIRYQTRTGFASNWLRGILFYQYFRLNFRLLRNLVQVRLFYRAHRRLTLVVMILSKMMAVKYQFRKKINSVVKKVNSA